MVYNERHDRSYSNQPFNSEVVHFAADGPLVSDEYQVDICQTANDEKYLDGSVVPRYEIEEDVVISCNEHQ